MPNSPVPDSGRADTRTLTSPSPVMGRPYTGPRNAVSDRYWVPGRLTCMRYRTGVVGDGRQPLVLLEPAVPVSKSSS